MSIIHQALKKAQREQQLAQGGTAWLLPAPASDGAPRRRRGQAFWIVTAALFALSLGATLHTWLASPTAHGTVPEPTRPVAGLVPQLQSVQPAKAAEAAFRPARRVADHVPEQQPAPSRTAGVTPVRPVQVAAARRPTPPATAADYTARGNALYHQGEYHRAIDMYRAALALNPLDVKARNNLGSTYLRLTLDDRASAAFQVVLRLDSSYSLAYYNLACVHGRAGNAASAGEYLRQAMAIDPEARVWAKTDVDFDPVRNAPEFRRLLEP